MRIPRIHFSGALATGSAIVLDETASAHILRVLRLQPGAPLIVFNGEGGEFDAVVETADRGRARVRIDRFNPMNVESPLAITLAQGISRGERMDFTLQKSVELGVTRIVPLITRFCQVRLDDERLQNRHRHWMGVITAASEQCGRTRLPELLPASRLDSWLAARVDPPAGKRIVKLVLHPGAGRRLSEIGATDAAILLIGPEGGLESAEIEQAQEAGFIGVGLGPRILRTETAGVAALAALQTLWGDLG